MKAYRITCNILGWAGVRCAGLRLGLGNGAGMSAKWTAVCERIVDAIRFNPLNPDSSAYSVKYGSFHKFGSDTFELAERVLKLAKKDGRRGQMKQIG